MSIENNNVQLLQECSVALGPRLLKKMATILQDNSIDDRTKLQKMERYYRQLVELVVMMEKPMKELECIYDTQLIHNVTQYLIVFANNIC